MSDRYEAGTREPARYVDSNPTAEPIKAGDLPGHEEFEGEKLTSVDVMDKPILIRRARRMKSTKSKAGFFYLCQCAWPETGELFTIILGGVVVTETLDEWARSGHGRPMLATLRKIEGGEYGKYHVLE